MLQKVAVELPLFQSLFDLNEGFLWRRLQYLRDIVFNGS